MFIKQSRYQSPVVDAAMVKVKPRRTSNFREVRSAAGIGKCVKHDDVNIIGCNRLTNELTTDEPGTARYKY